MRPLPALAFVGLLGSGHACNSLLASVACVEWISDNSQGAMSRKQAGLWCGSPRAVQQAAVRRQVPGRAAVRSQGSGLTHGVLDSRPLPSLKGLGGVTVAEMGKGAASSRPCCASTPDRQALTSPVGAFIHAAGEGGQARGGGQATGSRPLP